MNTPNNLKYSKSHEWFLDLGGNVKIGLTDYAQDQLGDIVFVNLPEVGDTLEVGGVFGDVESVKAVSDIYSPATGVVAAVNEELRDAPEKINDDCYEAWLIELSDLSTCEELLTAEQYEEFCATLG